MSMTRLDNARRKKYYSQLGMYLFLFILVIIFFSTIGIKLLVGTSLFVSGLKHKAPETQNYGDLMSPPIITDIPDATNSAELAISGTADAQKNLTVYVNDSKQKELVTDENGFTTTINLDAGTNTVYVEVEDTDKKITKKSDTHTVVYKNSKPKLEITSPADQEKVNKDEITIVGHTDAGNEIKVNGIPVVVSADGSFSTTVRLKEGENKINITTSDTAGNIETKELTLTYQRD